MSEKMICPDLEQREKAARATTVLSYSYIGCEWRSINDVPLCLAASHRLSAETQFLIGQKADSRFLGKKHPISPHIRT